MNTLLKLGLTLAVALPALANATEKPASPATQTAQLEQGFSAQFAALLPLNNQHTRVELGEQQAIIWRDAKQQVIAQYPQTAEFLDWRYADATKTEIVIATLALPAQQPLLLSLNLSERSIREVARLPLPSVKIEGLCLSRDEQNNLSLFLLSERGSAAHWLVMDGQGKVHPQHLRNLPVAPNSKGCSVDDSHEQLFISEESVGLWRHSAAMEANNERAPVDMRHPFGQIAESISAVAAIPEGLVALDSDARELLVYRQTADKFALVQRLALNSIEKPETLSANFEANSHAQNQPHTGALQLLIGDDKSHQQYPLTLPWALSQPVLSQQINKPELAVPSVVVSAEVQTDVMARFGDAADDPAIWTNTKSPSKSLVLGTNKQQGLFVYDLQGHEVQHFDTGKLNNVDVRYGVAKGKKKVDIAIASNRDDNSLAIYEINPRTGKLTPAGSIATDLKDIYGFCLYQSPVDDALYAIPNAKNGDFAQIRVSYGLADTPKSDANNHQKPRWLGETLRRFAVASQPEGCVADDQRQRLFIGEEDVGIWTLAAEPNSPAELQPVMTVGDVLVDDVEGLAIYPGPQPYLVVSSQGNNSYLILNATAPYALRGVVRVGLNAAKGIDGSSETDGLEVSAFNFGGVFKGGMLVVQDGHKIMPEAPQNFKYIAWDNIRQALQLD